MTLHHAHLATKDHLKGESRIALGEKVWGGDITENVKLVNCLCGRGRADLREMVLVSKEEQAYP